MSPKMKCSFSEQTPRLKGLTSNQNRHCGDSAWLPTWPVGGSRCPRRLSVGLAFSLVCLTPLAGAPAVLSSFRPSAARSAYGAVSEVVFSSELLDLDAGALAFHPDHAMRDFTFDEPVWIIGYKTEVLDAKGLAPTANYLCHTFFGDQRVTQHDDREMIAIYSDAFTPDVRLPDGFGLRLSAGEPLHWMPLFNNREETSVRIRMRGVMTVIREKDRTRPIQPLYSTLRSVRTPHLFFVQPGKHEFESTFQTPFDGWIHFIGTHIHPHGVSVELYDATRGRLVWRSSAKHGSDGRLIRMDTYANDSGYPVAKGDTLRIKAVYDNPTAAPIDAMAGLFVLYTRR
jgi:hypothetical protein